MAETNYDSSMELYQRLAKMGYKEEADGFMSDISKKYTEKNPAPPQVIQKGLEEIIKKHQSRQNLQQNQSPVQSFINNIMEPKTALAIAALALGIYLL